MSVHIRLGDCLQHENPCIIPHVVNSKGAWGAGFVLSISQISDHPAVQYYKWHRQKYCLNAKGDKIPFTFGQVQYCWLNPPDKTKIIANLLGQTLGGLEPPIKYWAVRRGLQNILQSVQILNNAEGFRYEIASPLLGAGLAGGKLEEIYAIIYDLFADTALSYYLYAFTEEDYKRLDKIHHRFIELCS